MIRGPKPKPREIREREGNPGKHPLPEPVNISSPSTLAPPEHFEADELEVWNRVVPTLREVGILDGVDAMALEALCVQFARARRAGRVIDRQGMFSKGSTGQLVEHPAVQAERQAHTQFLRFAEQYALTPVARTRLGLAELQRRSMESEMDEAIGAPELEPAA